nr:hypothetical protein [uncultured Acinetobacter sp.]
MNTTKILGEAVGIQSQVTVEKTETQTKEGLTSALIAGRFKRGRIDKPMTIHQGNIRGQLGHDPSNIDYQAVQDCLDTGVPSVQVLRVGRVVVNPEVPHIISCEGATENIGFFITGNWRIYIDDETEPYVGEISNALSQLLSSYSEKLTGDWDGSMFMQNIDNVPHRFKFVPVSNTSYIYNQGDNQTFVEDENGGFYFCLAAISHI